MKADTRRAILDYLRRHDARQRLVAVTPSPDLERGRIRFSQEIRQHRQETTLTGEKYAEAYFVVKLVKELGYDADQLELQKEYEIGRPKINRPRNDIILNRPDGTPFLLIEVKDPDEFETEADEAIEFQLFAIGNLERERALKYLVYCTVDLEGRALASRMRIIDFDRYRTYEEWVKQGSFSVDLLPEDYGLARKALFVNKKPKQLRPGERLLNQTSARTQHALDSLMPVSKPHKWAEKYLYGVEVNNDLALATKVNMVVHGDGSINVFAEDGLADFSAFSSEQRPSVLATKHTYPNGAYEKPVNESFDFIVSNPPFSIKPDARTAEAYSDRFEFGSSEKSENLFLERWFQMLRAGGRIGVVLPESVFDTTTAKATRLFLYRYFRLDAVVALPYLAFKPFTSTKTCILFATKRAPEDAESYIEAEKNYRRVVSKAVRRGIAFAEAEDDAARRRSDFLPQ